jgi:hypothetical protein
MEIVWIAVLTLEMDFEIMAQMTSRKMRDCRAGAAGPRSCGTRIYPAYRASPAGRRYDDPLYFSAVPQEGFETRPTHYKAWNRSVSAVHHFLLPCTEHCHRHRKCPLSVRRDGRGYIVVAVAAGPSRCAWVQASSVEYISRCDQRPIRPPTTC